jgi:plastocyanin
MRRSLLLGALAFSAAVHAFLAPEHLREEPLLGLLFVSGAMVELAFVAVLVVRPSRLAVAASTLTLAGMLVAYLPFVLVRLPGFPMTPEPLEQVALLTKAVELGGLAVGATLWTRPVPLSRQLAPAAATVCVACLVAGLAAPAPPSLAGTGGGQDRSVDIPGKYFSPDTLPVLVGDTITWTNHDSATHTVTGNEFDSGRLESGSRFSFTFSKAGVYRYHCAIHRFMHGEVDVYAVALISPASSVPLGATVTLTGLAPGGLQSVALEQGQADGSYQAVATSSVAPDGSFSFPVVVSGPSRYRVRAGEQVSEAVAIRPKPTVTISLRRVGERASVDIGAAPDQAGASVALERYLRERYWWKPVRGATLGAGGRVSFTVPAKAHRVRFRAHLLQGRGGWGEATSRAMTLP